VRRRDRLAALLFVVVTLVTALARRSAAGAEAAVELARASVSSGRSLDYARELTAIGPRLTGSAN